MGSVQTIIVFAAVGAFLLLLWPNSNSNSASFEDNLGNITANINPTSWQLDAQTITLGAAVAATILFPNPYTLFVGVYLVIYNILTAATNLITGGAMIGATTDATTQALITLINFILTTVFTLSLVSWFKGGSNL